MDRRNPRHALEILVEPQKLILPINHIWDELGDDYFLRENATDIAWHTQAILRTRTMPDRWSDQEKHQRAVRRRHPDFRLHPGHAQPVCRQSWPPWTSCT
jgi:hypothetical protein